MRHCPICATKFTNHEAFCPYDGTPTIADAHENVDPWVGVVVDSRYRIESRIGEGGMGIVYRASHVLLNKRIAIKVVRADHAKDSDVAERFMQEARAATSIGHPNIIDINDFGRMPDGSVYFAMEHLNGRGLDDLMEQGPLPMDVAIHIVEQITSALGAAHERGIVHRDLKPDNIFLIKHRDDEHFVKVLDFGIAKVAGGSSRTTRTGMVFGTPHYMSPEQAAGQSVDHRTDIYALGVMMYEMFTGQLPFDAETFMGVLTMHMYEAPPLPSGISPEIAARIGDLESVVLRALSKKPELRYQSMAELCADMKQVYRGGRPSVALDKTMLAGNDTADTLPPPPPAPPSAGAISAPPADAHDFESAAAALVSDTTGTLYTNAAPRSPNTLRWAAAAVTAAVIVGAVALATGGDDADASEPNDQPPAAAAQSPTVANTKSEPVVSAEPSSSPTPAVDPKPDAPIAAAESVRVVEIASTPDGAEVFHDGALLGTTPLSLPRPTEGAMDLQLKLQDHQPVLLRVTSKSAERIAASLAPVAVQRPVNTKTPTKPNKPTKQVASTPTVSPTPTAPAKRPGNTGTMRDMVDPWNE